MRLIYIGVISFLLFSCGSKTDRMGWVLHSWTSQDQIKVPNAVDTLSEGEQVKILEFSPDSAWMKVKSGNPEREGWIESWLIAKKGQPAMIVRNTKLYSNPMAEGATGKLIGGEAFVVVDTVSNDYAHILYVSPETGMSQGKSWISNADIAIGEKQIEVSRKILRIWSLQYEQMKGELSVFLQGTDSSLLPKSLKISLAENLNSMAEAERLEAENAKPMAISGEVKVEEGNFNGDGLGDCYHLNFSFGDFGYANTTQLSTEDLALWNDFLVNDTTNSETGKVPNPKYADSDFEIRYSYTMGEACNEGQGGEGEIPLVLSFKVKK